MIPRSSCSTCHLPSPRLPITVDPHRHPRSKCSCARAGLPSATHPVGQRGHLPSDTAISRARAEPTCFRVHPPSILVPSNQIPRTKPSPSPTYGSAKSSEIRIIATQRLALLSLFADHRAAMPDVYGWSQAAGPLGRIAAKTRWARRRPLLSTARGQTPSIRARNARQCVPAPGLSAAPRPGGHPASATTMTSLRSAVSLHSCPGDAFRQANHIASWASLSQPVSSPLKHASTSAHPTH